MSALKEFRRFGLVSALSIGAGVTLTAVLLLSRSGNGAGAQEGGVPARQWPAFSMKFTEYEVDATKGSVILDRTWDLRVEDDYTWRAELVRDGVTPDEEGSYRELRDGKYTSYSALLDHSNSTLAEATVAVTAELAPVFYAWVQDGMYLGKGFTEVEREPGYETAVRSDWESVERIEFSTAHVSTGYSGGITVGYEHLVRGETVRRLVVESLAVD